MNIEIFVINIRKYTGKREREREREREGGVRVFFVDIVIVREASSCVFARINVAA
jgi:hypothetical protein